MKLSLFVHMERTDPETPQLQLFDELEELVLEAEAAGFHAAWIGEHHGMEFTIAPNPFIAISHLAARTSRIRLGTGTIIAPFWHPVKLAGEAALTDLATRGRLDLGIARGAYSFEYERLSPGLDAMTAGQKMRELVPAVQKLWAGDYAHDGQFWQFPATTSAPKPLQQPGPPIWIAARDSSSHDYAVANGCNVQVTPLAAGDGEVTQLMQRFEAACAASPAIPRPKIMLLMHTFVAETAAEVDDLTDDLSRFYCAFGAWFANKRPVRNGFIEPLSDAEREAIPHFSPAVMRDNLVIGAPDAVIARLKAYEALGYDEYSVWIDSGISHARKQKSLRLFIDHVMPAFR